ncbi:MAG: hypothetical protein KC910_03575 [Candidatus Eremiobacteraeota bacterium]|nr:hypothetical protein [Candidatus Eremiobacteraeota bacterium]
MDSGDHIGGYLVLGCFDGSRYTVQSPQGQRFSLWKCDDPRPASALAVLSQELDPGLAPVLEVVHQNDSLYILTPPYEGPLLMPWQTLPSPTWILERFRSILHALVALHDHGMVHGRIDFGCLVGEEQSVLVDHWRKPPSGATARDDLLGLGRLMFHLATGKPRGEAGLLKLRPDFDLKLAAVLDKASHETGFSSAREMLATFNRMVEGKGEEASPPPPPVELPSAEPEPEPEDRPGVFLPMEALAGAGALLLVLLIGLVWMAGRNHHQVAATSTPTPTVAGTPSPTPSVDLEPTPGQNDHSDFEPTPEPSSEPEVVTVAPERPPQPAPTKEPLPPPRYPTHRPSYPRAERSPTREPATATGAREAYKLDKQSHGFSITVPQGWSVTKNSKGKRGKVLEMENVDGQEGLTEVTVTHEVEDIAPSRWKNSFTLKKEQLRWTTLEGFGGADLAFVKETSNSASLEAVYVRRMPYYQYRYVVVEVDSRGLDHEAFLNQAGELLDGFSAP